MTKRSGQASRDADTGALVSSRGPAVISQAGGRAMAGLPSVLRGGASEVRVIARCPIISRSVPSASGISQTAGSVFIATTANNGVTPVLVCPTADSRISSVTTTIMTTVMGLAFDGVVAPKVMGGRLSPAA